MSGSSLAVVEGEQGPVAEDGRGRRDGRVGAALAGCCRAWRRPLLVGRRRRGEERAARARPIPFGGCGGGGGGVPRGSGRRRRGSARPQRRRRRRRRAGVTDGGGGGVRLGSSGGSGEGGRPKCEGIGGVRDVYLMAHLPQVRHKYDDSNGAPHPGAPLEINSPTAQVIFPPNPISIRTRPLARLVSTQHTH